MTLSGGTFSNTGVLNIGSLNIAPNNVNVVLGGAGAVNLSGTGNYTSPAWCCWGSDTFTLDNGKVLTNNGTFNQNGNGGSWAVIALSNGASIVNSASGVWNLNGAQINTGTLANGGFTNNGSVVAGAGIMNGTTVLTGGSVGVAFNNNWAWPMA